MRWIGLVVALVALGACTKKDPLFCDGTHACSEPTPFCDVNGEYPASDGIKNTCIASPYDAMPDAGGCGGGSVEGATTCSGSTLMTCNSGSWVSSECPLGCFTDGTRCWDVDPSNGLAQYLDKAADGPDVVLTDGAVIDVGGNASRTVTRSAIPAPFDSAPQSGGRPGHPRLRGPLARAERCCDQPGPLAIRPIAFVVDGDVTVQGHVALGGDKEVPGPGGRSAKGTSSSAGTACIPQLGDFSGAQISGSGGGGFGGTGGRGGANGGIAGGVGALPDGDETGEPLVGGCGGGFGSSTAAVGAAAAVRSRLVSRSAIRLEPGILDAGGGGGLGPAAGGGSGGLILLEAPTITLVGSGAAVVVNGGGGGGGGVGDGTICSSDGENGTVTTTPAAGGACQIGNTDGGDGGAGTTPAGNGVDDPGGTASGTGGGGGSVGRIRLNTVSATISQGAGTVVSGNATYGTLKKR